MLITLDGHSGAGKSSVMRRLSCIYPELVELPKTTNVWDAINNAEDFKKRIKGIDTITDWYVNHFVYSASPTDVPSQFETLGLPFHARGCYHFVLLLDDPSVSINRVIKRDGSWKGDVDRHRVSFEYTNKFYESLIKEELLIGVNAMNSIDSVTYEIRFKD